MSVRLVARRDITSVLRSRGLWTGATLLVLLVAVFSFGYEGHRLSETGAVQDLFSTLGMALGVLLPIVALVASYLAIAGERRSGAIKFLLGFPNTRLDIYLGKLGSRLAVVAGVVGFTFFAATSVAAAKYGSIPLPTIVGVFAVSLVYASVFVCIAVALSAAIASRSRAIAAAFGSYFVLVILYAVPVFRITTIVEWVHRTMLGFERNQTLYDAIRYTSPYVAYRKATNLVLPPDLQAEVFRRSGENAPELPVYLSDEFSVIVFGAWIAVALVVGYLRFERAEID